MIDKLTENLIENLKTAFNERLSSVILYGSCAVDNCNISVSDINLMVIINDLVAADLKKANPLMKDWMKTKHPLPIFMDREEWFSSCDVYPIEYSDIKERYKILYGENIVDNLYINKNDLRLQCEHEVKDLIIRLRQTYLAKSSDKKAIEELIKKSSKSFVAIFRAILRLSDTNVPFKHEDVINLLSQKVEVDREVFLKILSFRTNSKVFANNEYETQFKS